MEIESTNHQDVAEPGQISSGVTGAGQNNATEMGIDEHETGKFSLFKGFDRILQGPEDPDGFSCAMAFVQTAGTAQNPAAFTREISPAFLKKSRKNKLVIGMGVLYNGEIKPVVYKNHTTAPAIQDMEDESEVFGEKSEDLIISFYEQQDRMVERATKKIDRLNNQLTALKEQRRLV